MTRATKTATRKPESTRRRLVADIDTLSRTVFEASSNSKRGVVVVEVAESVAEARAFAKGLNLGLEEKGEGEISFVCGDEFQAMLDEFVSGTSD